MGGRGTISLSGADGYEIDIWEIYGGGAGGGQYNSDPESRADVLTMFANAGVEFVGGTQDLDSAVLGSVAIQLANLEKQYGAIGASDFVHVGTITDPNGFIAAVATTDANTSQLLVLNTSYFDSVSTITATQRKGESSGFFSQTDGSILSSVRYAVTHEYGHMLENSLYNNAKANGYSGTSRQYATKVKDQVLSIATSRYGARQSDVSSYGTNNSMEFFAEAFTNANLGSSNAIGNALTDWLNDNGL